MKTKQLHEITVTEITNMADIGRTTFYLHYTDVYDLLFKIESEILHGFIMIFEVNGNENKTQSLIRRVEESLIFIENNHDICKTLFSSDSFLNKFQQNCCEVFINEFYSNDISDFGITEVNFVAWGVVGTFKNWVMGDLKVKKEQLNKNMLYIFARFLDGVEIQTH